MSIYIVQYVRYNENLYLKIGWYYIYIIIISKNLMKYFLIVGHYLRKDKLIGREYYLVKIFDENSIHGIYWCNCQKFIHNEGTYIPFL